MLKKENFDEFKFRLGKFEGPVFSLDKMPFKPKQAVLDKVALTNHFNPFYGDTIVFDLSFDVKRRVFQIINELYYNAPECFSEKLNWTTIHLTLHDLSNSPYIMNVLEQMNQNQKKIEQLRADGKILPSKIRMETNFLCNMNHTSMVLAARPVDEENYKKIMSLYYIFDEVRELDYYFTPHITLGYYNRHGFGVESVCKLEQIVNKLNSEYVFEFDLDVLLYERFMSMNWYATYISLF